MQQTRQLALATAEAAALALTLLVDEAPPEAPEDAGTTRPSAFNRRPDGVTVPDLPLLTTRADVVRS